MPESHSNLPTVLLKPGEADRLLAGHPWVYQAAILRLTHPAADGAIVQVKDHRQRFIGIGLFNSKSKIHVRLLARERTAIDARFFERRIQEALAHRRCHLPGATSFRVVNAESDFLSGLLIDKYSDVVAVQTSSFGMDQRQPLIVGAIKKLLSPKAIVERNDVASRRLEGLAESVRLIEGQMPDPLLIQMNGLSFQVDPLGGHKTGFYLDQQENYRAVADLISRLHQPQVLDCFTFHGGFALHAARAGAAHVHAIDQSEEAIAEAARNAATNGLSEKISFEAANVFDWLKDKTMAGPNEKLVPQFDAVILDPPSFTRNRAAVGNALRGYKEIHLRSMRLLKPGGLIVTFCCSHHVDGPLFEQVILDAAYDAKRVLRRVASFSQGLDHPVIPSIPETHYLKGFAFEVLTPP